MKSNNTAKETEGTLYLKRTGFHRRFTLPATTEHGAIQVSYSDVGRQPTTTEDQSNDESPPVILFMPGMFASRFASVFLDAMGQKIGVRIVTVDRPGMGSTTQVKLDQRIKIWVEIVPQLLAHLGIQHVSLVSHSAGTCYLLNALYSCLDVLSPTRPYAFLMAPWVDVKHSGMKVWQAAQRIPNAAFGSMNKLVQSVAIKIAPAIGSSIEFMGKCLSNKKRVADPEPSENRRRWQEEYGLSDEFLDSVTDACLHAMCNESTVGANDEARQCLKKEGNGIWGECEDYQEFVAKLVALERSRAGETKLKVKMFFAEEDSMIGKRGQRYMESCWDRGEFADVLDFRSTTVDDTDHDSIVMMADVLEEVLGYVTGNETTTTGG